MENVDYLIVGGGISGTTAAETIRSNDPNSRIVIISDEKYPLYSRVKIPYYLREVRTREELFLRSSESYKEKNIEYLTETVAEKLDSNTSTLATLNGEVFHYGKLLITTGGTPKKLNKYQNEHSMQTIEDADKILEDAKVAKRGVIIGSGFISLEFLEVFLHFNLETHLCVVKEGFWANFLSPQVSDLILSIISSRGVSIHRGDVPEFINNPDVIVGTGIGIDVSRPFFADSGLTFDGGLVVDSNLKTNFENIYAAGDVAKFYSQKLQRQVKYGNWTNAVMSGKCAGENMVGGNLPYDTLSAYSISPEKLSIVFLGFAGVDDSTQTKTQILSGTEGMQFFIRNGKLDGCILINRSQDRQKYQQIIENRESFSK